MTTIPRENKEIPRYSAPAVVAELFNHLKDLASKPKSIYVRSEVQETFKQAVEFYQKMGFKKVSDKNISWSTPKDPLPLSAFLMADSFAYASDLTTPMAISMKKAVKSFESVANKFQRKTVENPQSIDLGEVVK